MAKELKLYLPLIFQDIAEYEALSNAETPLIADLEEKTDKIVDESFLSTMSEARLIEWENALGIVPRTTNLTQRRSVVLSRFRGTGKLSKTVINAIVNAFTGGSAVVTFEDGVIYLKVAPPSNTFVDFSTETLIEELNKRKPAHLMINVELAYITWGQLRTAFSSWQEIRDNLGDWSEVKQYYTNQEVYSLWR